MKVRNSIKAALGIALVAGGISTAATYHRQHTTKTHTPQTAQTVQTNATCKMRGQLPDPVCTPGSVNPSVTQATIGKTICIKGWTATVRPPVSYTDSLKQKQMTEYGFHDTIVAHEEDHLIPLELGGNPSDPANLWPEPGKSPNPKDSVENRLRQEVCAGQLPLTTAQQEISHDWTTAQ